jgi:hypothetical protein
MNNNPPRELTNHFLGVKILKFFDADPVTGIEKIRIRDLGWKNSDPGWKKVGSVIRDINIPDPQHWLKYLNSVMRIRYPGWKKIRIRDPE